MAKANKRKRDAGRAKAIAAVTEQRNETPVPVCPGSTRERVASVGARLVHVGMVAFISVAMLLMVARGFDHDGEIEGPNRFLTIDGIKVPRDMLGRMEDYPNLLNITENDRQRFHPVVKFPQKWSKDEGEQKKKILDFKLLDLTVSLSTDQLATEDDRKERALARSRWKKSRPGAETRKGYAVGRYDENRVNLYSSNLFDDTTNTIDGYAGARTVHMGIDLDGPLGTKVFAFTEGTIHKVGYNAELGDYGNVMVVEHNLGPSQEGEPRLLFALYGHLDSKSIKGKKEGQKIKKGQVLGRMGDIHENGGWRIPHVHFQLALTPPETHDMPGIVSVKDRQRALIEYPDPRLVLGSLY